LRRREFITLIRTSFEAQAAHFRFSPDSRHIAASHSSATNPKFQPRDEIPRMAVNFAKLTGQVRRKDDGP
jgi:hypothetical protein